MRNGHLNWFFFLSDLIIYRREVLLPPTVTDRTLN